MSGEYTRQDFDELVARLKKLEPPTVTDCLGLVIGYTDLLAERDALAADLARISSEMGLPPTIGPAPGALAKLLDDGQAAVAELAKVKAGLPRWSKGRNHAWVLGAAWSGDVGFVSPSEGRWLGHAPTRVCLLYDTREAAMLAVTEALGLPPCEVEGD